MSAATTLSSGPALVLIVDDEEPLADTVAFVVQKGGYRPLVALHGRQALEYARAQRPALVLADLMLPYLDGAELIAALRADAAARGEAAPPIVLMTAASPALARAAGADGLLRKPFSLAELQGVLTHFLGTRPETQSAAHVAGP